MTITKRPWEILPVPHPQTHDPSDDDPEYFYQNFIKPLTKDFIRIMNNGMYMDEQAVEALRTTLDTILLEVEQNLASSPIIQEYQASVYPAKYEAHKAEKEAMLRSPEYYLKEYKPENIDHRTFLVNFYLGESKLQEYVLNKWTVAELKKVNTVLEDPFLDSIIHKNTPKDHPTILNAMQALAEKKSDTWNKAYYDQIEGASPETLMPPFNPASAPQKKALFEHLGIEPLAFSKDTGEASWGRDQIEELYKTAVKGDFKDLMQAFIDHSFGAIVRNNFIESFDKFTIDGRLFGNLKLFGTKTFRPTSNAPNLLNMPSTGSIYAKPLKKCFVAPPGYLVWTIDYAALNFRGSHAVMCE